MKKHLIVVITGLIAGGLLYGFFAFNDDLSSVGGTVFQLLISGLGGVVLGYLVLKINSFLNQLVPWRTNVGLRMLLGIMIISLVAFSIIWSGINIFSGLLANDFIGINNYFSQLVKLGLLILIATITYQVVYFALHSYYIYTMLHVEEVKAQRKQTEYQLEALKSQLSPHFLFNNLNSISALAFSDTQMAESFIRKMAALYENMLKDFGSQLIKMSEEIENVKAYYFLMHSRFGESLQLKIDLDKNLYQSKIPPLSIQLLIENAIKHNVISDDQPLTISIKNNSQYILVTNHKTGPRQNVTSYKIGLKNIRNRYRLISQKDIVIHDGSSFTVNLPILT